MDKVKKYITCKIRVSIIYYNDLYIIIIYFLPVFAICPSNCCGAIFSFLLWYLCLHWC